MNPMYFVTHKNPHRARYWFLRTGTNDTDTSPVILSNLATISRDVGDSVNEWLYWDAGHGAKNDPAAFIQWIGRVTGYTKESPGNTPAAAEHTRAPVAAIAAVPPDRSRPSHPKCCAWLSVLSLTA